MKPSLSRPAELVRLGVKPANDQAVLNSLPVIDAQLGMTRNSARGGLAAPARKGIALAALSFRARLANRRIATVVRQAFQCGNRGLALASVSHRYKTESTAHTAHAIGNHLHISYGPIGREEITQLVFGGGE